MKVDFEEIKRTTDLVRVIESYGITLKKVGKDHVGLCPFHEDRKPSLRVTASKGLFRCPVCEVAGNVLQFVAKKEKISEREAGIKLLKSIPGVKPASQVKAKTAEPKRTLSSAESAALLQRVVAFYLKTLHKDRAGLDYLKTRKLEDPTMLEVFGIGYSNGTLLGAVPKEGELIDQLKTLGVLNAKGREHFEGHVTVPLFDAQGNVVGIYGRRITPIPPESLERPHRYLPIPLRGVFNGNAAKTSPTLLVCEAILDAMSLWQAGFRNVISLFGAGGWTPDHTALLREHNTQEVFLCLDNDDAGQAGAAKLKETVLPELVKAVHGIQWPEGIKDANDFFSSRSPSEFEALLQAAKPTTPSPAEIVKAEEKITMRTDGFAIAYGSRRYELRAIEQPSAGRLRATVKAVSTEPQHAGRFHIDTVDFYLSRSRRAFLLEAARLFREKVETVEEDVNRLIGQAETFAANGAKPQQAGPLISDTDRAEAQKLGKAPDLVDEILRDMERLGMIGETANKLIGYLTMTTRKLPDPLALLILSGSGAGKSHLQDTILSFCPEEDLIKLTSLTDRALFYKGEDSLRHKVLAVEELAGAQGAGYAIRNLISAKKLVIESTVKNPLTGKLETQTNTVHGPTAVFQTTTNPRTDAETRSRFILVSVDESLEQTRVILQAQRQSHTLEGWRRRLGREGILKRHHAFQRLLKPLRVVNPFEGLLTYPEDQLLVRRDHPKYLNLILAVTFLYQMQRPVKRDEVIGDEYLETTLEDIAIANDLAHQLFGHSLDDLSCPSRNLLELITGYVAQKSAGGPADKVTFNRRELRETFKWGDTRLRTHLEELIEMEYVLPLSGRFGQTFQYRLLCGSNQEPGRFLAGLKSVEKLRVEANLAGGLPNLAPQKANLAPTSQVEKREVENGQSPNKNGHFVKPMVNLAPVLKGVHGRNRTRRSLDPIEESQR